MKHVRWHWWLRVLSLLNLLNLPSSARATVHAGEIISQANVPNDRSPSSLCAMDGRTGHGTDEWPFVPSAVMLDMQEMHATTIETPPSSKPPTEWQHEMYFNEPVSQSLSQLHWLEF